ncbi:hypothetical protein FGG79_14550 [Bacillus sp. BHET2]|uniref:hypothetical protein n=1 Tax=Bacillus sp. BHET2 TaxID=2583818 RepID=UPI00110E3345|nr:hypothetical protein [Bacillus sp. BHET2]TMU85100.1 hypothetical protein FGG79_14550 [Bacillus sp. BHET2]
MGKKELTWFIGGTAGLIIGFVICKIYQIWAILYEDQGLALEGVTSWEGTPLWKTVNDNPGTALFVIMVFFLIVGLCFSYLISQSRDT